LAREKKLSISTVVQALRQLEERGQVEARPQSGFFVRLPSSNQNPQLVPQTRQRLARPVAVDINSRLMGVLALNNQTEMVPLGCRLAGC